MRRHLIRHGHRLALVIDEALLARLGISRDTPLEIRAEGNALIVTRAADPARHVTVREALRGINKRRGKALARLGVQAWHDGSARS